MRPSESGIVIPLTKLGHGVRASKSGTGIRSVPLATESTSGILEGIKWSILDHRFIGPSHQQMSYNQMIGWGSAAPMHGMSTSTMCG